MYVICEVHNYYLNYDILCTTCVLELDYNIMYPGDSFYDTGLNQDTR